MISGRWSVFGDQLGIDLMQATAKGQSRSSLRSYRDLDVWQKSMELVVSCYELSERFPTSETYGLGAAISIPANIAEGQGRNHTKEFINHLSMAYGSLMEVETHLQIAARLNYVDSLQL